MTLFDNVVLELLIWWKQRTDSEVAMNAKPHPPPVLEPSPNTDKGKALSPMAIYIFFCPLGHEHGFPKQGRTQEHGDVRKAKCGTATKE